MKIDMVLTACNMNYYYLNLFPYVRKVWKDKFNLDLFMILINDFIPENLIEYKNFIVLFKPIENMNTCYIAQVIRILYPSLFEDKNIIITDMDIIPISKKYYLDSIEKFSNNQFISYTDRYVNNKMLAICYNLANSNVWKKIFNINSIDDINKILVENYNQNYNGRKNCDGWYLDQQLLFKYVSNYKKIYPDDVIILNDIQTNYNRLDGKGTQRLNEIKQNQSDILVNINKYSDFHIIRGYDKNLTLLNNIIDAILSI